MEENKAVETKKEEPNQATQPQKVDTEAIIESATQAAIEKTKKILEAKTEKMVEDRLSRAAKVLEGKEDDVDPELEILKRFAHKPTALLKDVASYAEDRALSKFEAKAKADRIQQEVITNFTKEYPELSSPSKAKIVDALAKDKVAQGMDYKAALEESFKETATEFGLKPNSERQREASYAFGIPLASGGGYAPTGSKPFDEHASQRAFVEAQKKRAASFKRK